MKNLYLVLLFVTQLIYAQNYQTVEEVDNICSQLGFASDEEAQIAVDKILNEMGIPTKSFKLRSCPNINNAVAKNIKDANGNYERYILYDINFMKRISDNAQNDWSAISVLAHEIGHHLSGHSLNNKGSNHKWELEADYFSGVSLAKMGATLQEAQSAIQTLRYEKETSTHPAKADRLIEIEKGWIAGGGNSGLKLDLAKIIKPEEVQKLKVSGIKTESGIIYQILYKGSGLKPTKGTRVLINYAGYLEDGSLFDTNSENAADAYNNYNGNVYKPFPFIYGDRTSLVRGFVDAIEIMNFGDKYIFYLPSNLMYGDQGAGDVIPPNTNLVYIIELIQDKVQKN